MLRRSALVLTVAVALLALVNCEVAFPEETYQGTGTDGGSGAGGTGTGGTAGTGGSGGNDCFPTPDQKYCGKTSCPSKTDPAHGCAGTSCAACTIANATATCAADGTCALGTCDPGFTNCDGNPTNGCEIDTDHDPTNCGMCGHDCFAQDPTKNWSCQNGQCVVSTCAVGKGDCNNNATDGCETNLTSDPKNCKFCGNDCSTTVQHATPTCVNSSCSYSTCDPGWADCDGNKANGCEQDIATDPSNCGACGNKCDSTNGLAACQGGKCMIGCNSGFGNCNGIISDGCEANLNTDPTNCGKCANACSTNNATASCSSGTCQLSCKSGFKDCDQQTGNGCEADLSSPTTCGSCSMDCTTQVLHATATCALGSCSYSSCSSGWADCDNNKKNGCEKNIGTDVNNCGSCGNKCTDSVANASGVACSAGNCTYTGSCNSGWADCDNNKANGCEKNTSADANNCGACNYKCASHVVNASGLACLAGNCTYTGSCNSGWADCDNNKANGCEADLTSNATCGSCAISCTGGTNCLGGTCQ